MSYLIEGWQHSFTETINDFLMVGAILQSHQEMGISASSHLTRKNYIYFLICCHANKKGIKPTSFDLEPML
jgi:hypothetical protein